MLDCERHGWRKSFGNEAELQLWTQQNLDQWVEKSYVFESARFARFYPQ